MGMEWLEFQFFSIFATSLELYQLSGQVHQLTNKLKNYITRNKYRKSLGWGVTRREDSQSFKDLDEGVLGVFSLSHICQCQNVIVQIDEFLLHLNSFFFFFPSLPMILLVLHFFFDIDLIMIKVVKENIIIVSSLM